MRRRKPSPLLSLRDRLVLLAFLVPVAAAGMTCVSCIAPRVAGVIGPRGETPHMEYEATVEIRVVCPDGNVYGGSGVVVGTHRVVTAAHVIACEGQGAPVLIGVNARGDGSDYLMAAPDAVLPAQDIARLTVAGDLSRWYHPITFAPDPDIGDELCEVAVQPRYDYRCGRVEYVYPDTVRVSMVIEHGNSGAAVYDSQGRLVGFMVSAIKCEGGSYCSGNVARVSGLNWLQE